MILLITEFNKALQMQSFIDNITKILSPNITFATNSYKN